MNKRIKELAEQAELIEIVDDAYQERGTWQPFVEKFAELLIKECIERGNDLANHYINKHSEQNHTFLLAAIADYSNEIKKHFGVIHD